MLGVTAGGGGHVPLCPPAESAPGQPTNQQTIIFEVYMITQSKKKKRKRNANHKILWTLWACVLDFLKGMAMEWVCI